MNPGPADHREERFAQSHSADVDETLFSTKGSGGDGAGSGLGGAIGGPGRDRLSEAVEVMAQIRRHGQWESSQTHDSLLPYLIEESWELVDAVADGDRDDVVSELGDLLLQVLFHSAIGAERPAGTFDVQDVAGALLDKLRRRAPYWFDDSSSVGLDAAGSGSADPASAEAGPAAAGPAAAGPAAAGPAAAAPAALDAAEQDRLWQEAKAAERVGRPPRGVVDDLPWGMPALALGQKVLARARSAGFPDDLVPAEMRVVYVDAAQGLFSPRTSAHAPDPEPDRPPDAHPDLPAAAVDPSGAHTSEPPGAHESGSAEVAYRQVVRRFADRIRAAESRLGGPSAIADAAPADWRTAWV